MKIIFDRLFKVRFGYVELGDCPAVLEPPAGARNRRKATVKIRRNAPQEALSRKGLYPSFLIPKIPSNFRDKIYLKPSNGRTCL